MTSRDAIAVLAILAAGASTISVPFAVFLGLGAVMVAIDASDPDRRAARRRARPVEYFQARRAGQR